MEIKKIFIVLADISGYTRFMKLHKWSLLHAEKIITELLESIIAETSSPLVFHEVLGDAVSFYAVSDDTPEMAQNICQQVQRFFKAFQIRERELLSDCSVCHCDACGQVGQLKLKMILHHGEAVFTKVRHLNKVAGEDVILAHRLLKNSIKGNEYVLLSQAFYEKSAYSDSLQPERRNEYCAGIGNVKVMVYYPNREAHAEAPINTSWWTRLKTTAILDGYAIKRLLTKPSQRYENLERAQLMKSNS